MTTPTNSHKAWTDKGGHVTLLCVQCLKKGVRVSEKSGGLLIVPGKLKGLEA